MHSQAVSTSYKYKPTDTELIIRDARVPFTPAGSMRFLSNSQWRGMSVNPHSGLPYLHFAYVPEFVPIDQTHPLVRFDAIGQIRVSISFLWELVTESASLLVNAQPVTDTTPSPIVIPSPEPSANNEQGSKTAPEIPEASTSTKLVNAQPVTDTTPSPIVIPSPEPSANNEQGSKTAPEIPEASTSTNTPSASASEKQTALRDAVTIRNGIAIVINESPEKKESVGNITREFQKKFRPNEPDTKSLRQNIRHTLNAFNEFQTVGFNVWTVDMSKSRHKKRQPGLRKTRKAHKPY